MRLSRQLAAAAALIFALGAVGSVASADGGPAWLGIAMETKDHAVVVARVISGSPADKAGIRAGDRIERVDGTRITDPADVQKLVGAHSIGDTAAVTVERAGSDTTLRVKVAPRPTVDEMLRMDRVGKAAPPWIGVEAVTGGAPLSPSTLRGRVGIIEFWATWCGPCRATAPELTRLQSRYGAQGLTVMGITTDAKDVAAEYVERHGLGFSILSDPSADTTRVYGVSALPTLFVVDKRGVVRDVAVGFAPENTARVETLVTQLLAEPGP